MLGTVLLLVGTVALLVALLEGGVLWSWTSPVSVGLLVGRGPVLVAFVLVERRAAEPVLPLWVFRHRVVGAAMATSLVVGVLLLGLTSYVPLFAQGVLGTGAIVAGFALAAMTIGWPIAATTSGRLYLRFGFRLTMLLGAVIALVGAALLLTVDARARCCTWRRRTSSWAWASGTPRARRSSRRSPRSAGTGGVATGATLFARSVGSAVGVAAFGAMANAVVRSRLGSEPTDLESLPAGVLDPAIHAVFVASFVVALLLVVAAAFMPKRVDEVTD